MNRKGHTPAEATGAIEVGSIGSISGGVPKAFCLSDSLVEKGVAMYVERYENPVSSDSSMTVEQATKPKPRVVSLFAGIGGFDRALDLAGAKTVLQCESDAYCRAVLKRHWPDVIVSDDINSLMPEEIPQAEVWTAGFPCQDVSLARGNHGRTGLKGNQTSLFFRLAELIEKRNPEVILLENVVGLLNSHKGKDFAIILRELVSHGYAVSWRVVNARYFGAPQSRSRVFMCAWRGDYKKAVTTLFEAVPGAKVGSERDAFLKVHKDARTGAVVPEIAYCVAATSGRHTGNDWSRSYVSYADTVRRPTPTESERLQGFPENWTIPDQAFGVPARGLDSDRYKAVGNAVAIPVVKWIADRLLARLKERSSSQKGDFATTVQKLAPELSRGHAVVNLDEIEQAIEGDTFAYRWKSGGCAFKSIAVEGIASPAPSTVIPARFVDALDTTVPDERYFLTANAAIGILRRADSVGRNLFQPMRAALENLVGIAQGEKAPPSATGASLAKSSICPPRSKQRGKVKRVGTGTWRRLSAQH